MLEVKNAVKVFAAGTPNEFKALNGLNLKLEDGEFVTIIGSNGAGKSTLFNAICGNFWLDKGHIILDGEDISYKSEHKRARRIGRIFQDPMKGTAPHLTIEENLARLDEIISKLDNKDTSLEDAFKEYESGIKLVKECNDAIDKVEKDVITLNGGEDSDKDNDI